MKAKELRKRIQDALFDGIELEEDQTEHEAAELLIREYTEAVIKEWLKEPIYVSPQAFTDKLFKEEDEG